MSKEKNSLPKSYAAASEELENIVEALQSDQIDVDKLAAQVKRAKVLINYCQNKLRSTEREVNDLFSETED